MSGSEPDLVISKNRLYILEQKQSENGQEIVRYKQEITKYKQITEECLSFLELKQRETEGELAELKALAKKQLAVQHRKDVVADESDPLNANSSMRDQVKDAVAVRVGYAVKIGSNVKVKNGVKSKDSVDKVHHDDPASVAQGLEDTTPSRDDALKVTLNPSGSGKIRLLLHDSSQDRPAERPPISPKLKPTYYPVPSLDTAPRSSKDDLFYQYRALSPFPGVKFADLMADNPKKRWFGNTTPLTKDPLQRCPAALVTLSFPGLGANQTIYFTLTHGPFTSNDLGRLAARQIAARLEEIARAAKTWPFLPPLKLGERWLRTLKLEDLTLLSLTPWQFLNPEGTLCMWWKANLMMQVMVEDGKIPE